LKHRSSLNEGGSKEKYSSMQSLHTFGVSVIGHVCFYKNAHIRNNMSILVNFSVILLLEICELNNGVNTLFLGYLANFAL
jgi:hypothetical protein